MVVSLYQPSNKGYQIPDPSAAERLAGGISALFSPSPFRPSELQAIQTEFGEWYVDGPQRGTTNGVGFKVNEFIAELSEETIGSDFRRKLAHISTCPIPERPQAVSFLNLSRFCEMRSALSAVSLPDVSNVFIAAPNSFHDRAKADLLLELPDKSNFEVQIKAGQGKKSRIATGIPTLRDVFSLSLSEVTTRIGNFLHEHLRRYY